MKTKFTGKDIAFFLAHLKYGISDFTSKKFRFWSLIWMLLLVFVNGYNLDIRYMQPWTIPGQSMTLTAFTEYFLANGIFRFRIPMLFIISGFLFALHDQKFHENITSAGIMNAFNKSALGRVRL